MKLINAKKREKGTEWKTEGGHFGDKELGKLVLIDYPLYVTRELNENFMGVIIGMPGKGKTWAACRLAEQIDPTFNIDRVCVTYKEFLEVMKQLSDEWTMTHDVSGKVVVFDEFQQSSAARKWQSNVNMAINDVLHTFRFMNLIVIFTTPHMSFIDVNARAVMHFQVIMKKKDRRRGTTEGKLQFTEIKNDPRDPSDKLYHFAPRVFTDKGILKVASVFFEKPTPKLRKQVDVKVNTFKRDVLEAAIEKADRQEKEVVKRKSSTELAREFSQDIFDNRERYLDPVTHKWDQGAMLLDYPDLSSSTLVSVRKMLKAMEKRSLG